MPPSPASAIARDDCLIFDRCEGILRRERFGRLASHPVAGEERPADDKRLDGSNPFGDSLFTERNWAIVEALRSVATEAKESPARIALAWLNGRPGVASILLGVSRAAQVNDNVAALEVILSPAHRAALDAVSVPTPRMLYGLFSAAARQHVVFGGSAVRGWNEQRS